MKNRELLLKVNSDDDIRRIRYVGVNHYTLSFYDEELIFSDFCQCGIYYVMTLGTRE